MPFMYIHALATHRRKPRKRTGFRRALTSLFLAVCLPAVSFLAACASDRQTRTPDRSVLPASLNSLSFDEHLDISVGYWNIDGMENAQTPDGMTQYIESLFNITLHPVSVTWANYKERYQILSATDSLPDVFATLTLSSNDSSDSATFDDMIRSGSIRALPDDLSAFPQLSAILSEVSYTRYTDGRFYAVPRLSFTDASLGSTDAAMVVRRDWMDALGLSDPQSFEEFAAMTRAFAMDDPDGNGLDDTIGYNINTLSALGKWVILGIAPECNTYAWIEENGRYIPAWSSEQFTDVVRAFRTLYECGGLDPNFYTKSTDTVMDDFASGRLGALEYKSSPSALMELKEKWDAVNEKPFEDCVDVLPIFPAPDGVRYSNSSSVFWSESYLSSDVDDAKAERILALYEFLLSPQGQEFCHYGIESVDYRHEADGSLTCLIDTQGQSLTTALLRKYPSQTLFAGIASWGGSWDDFAVNDINALRYGRDVVILAHRSAVWNRDHTTQVERPYAFLSAPKEPTDLFGTSRAFDAFIRCILGDNDPAAMWEAALEEMRAQGLDNYIDRQNENFEKLYLQN